VILLKVLVVRPSLAKLIAEHEEIIENSFEIISPKGETDEELLYLVEDVEIIVCTRLSAEVAKKAKKMKLLQKTGAGVDALPFEAIGDDVLVANTSGSNPVPLAEGTIAMILTLAKRIVLRNNLFPDRDYERGIELRDKNLGIIGFGSIGIEIAKRMKAFKMNILGIKRRPSEELKKELGLTFLGGQEDLDYVLKESDFIVLTLPLTPTTRGIIGEHEINMMKSSAFIINVGRAALIEEKPIYEALKEERIAGGAFDVWWVPHWWDPNWKPEIDKPSRYPIWELPNVLKTPHNVGFVKRTTYSNAAIEIIVENIIRTGKGKQPINQVNKEHQY